VASTLAQEPIAVETWAKSLHHGFWYRRQVAAGTNGPIDYACTKRQVTLGSDSRPTRTVWWVMKRPMGATPSSWS
jgi:hypothetical protein